MQHVVGYYCRSVRTSESISGTSLTKQHDQRLSEYNVLNGQPLSCGSLAAKVLATSLAGGYAAIWQKAGSALQRLVTTLSLVC